MKLLNLFPAPNASGLNGNYSVNRNNTDDTNAFDVRIDQNFSESDSIFGRFSCSNANRFRPGPFDGDADGGGFNNGTEAVRTMGAALSYTHSFRPTLINESRIGFNREHVYRVQANGDDTSNIPLKYGIPGVLQTAGQRRPALLQHRRTVAARFRRMAGQRTFLQHLPAYRQPNEDLRLTYFKGGFEAQQISFPWIAPPYSRGEFSSAGASPPRPT